MTAALELVGAFLSAATLLTAAMFLAAFQLGRLITRDDEQREVEVARALEMADHALVMGTVSPAKHDLAHRLVRRAGAERWRR